MSFRFLILEDNKNHSKLFKQMLNLAFEDYGKPDLEEVDDPDKAEDVLRQRGADFQIFFVDRRLPDPWREGLPDPRTESAFISGFKTIKAAVRHPNLAVVAITDFDDQEARREFRDLGGHLFLTKEELKQMLPNQLLETLRGLLEARGHFLRPIALKKNEPSPLTDALLESIGENNLIGLLGRIMPPEVTACEPKYVAPGFSGASVLRVDGYNESEKVRRQLLVKLSHDKEKLASEIEQAPKPGELGESIYVHYGDQVVSFSKWHAIWATFETDAVTLQRWLTSPEQYGEDPRRILSALLINGLGREYQQGAFQKGQHVFDVAAQHLDARARIWVALRRIEGILYGLGQGDGDRPVLDMDLFRNLLWEKQIGRRPASTLPLNTYTCMSHGDLHGRNVLVSIADFPVPRLIDTARRKVRHWPSDPARLCADLWLMAWAGVRAHYWEDLALWRRQITAWLGKSPIPEVRDGDQRVMIALEYIRDHLNKMFDREIPAWEFQLLFVLELLAMSSYDDTPMPKRCLAVLAAQDLLGSLEGQIPVSRD